MKRHCLRLFLLTVLTTLVLAVGVHAASTGIITGDVVNARKGPGTSYERVELLAKGKQVTILGEENGWYHIQWNDSKGYVLKDYISLGSGSGSTGSSGSSGSSVAANATVTGGSTINVRSGAGTSFSRIAMVGTGKRVAVLEQSGSWYKVSFDGKTGYIMSDYIARDGSSGSSSSASANATVTGGSTINVRSGPSTSASRTALVAEGKRVAVLEQTGDWYKVSVDGKTGYIYKDFLKRDGSSSAASASTSEPKTGNATVKDNNVNVRSSASASSERVTKVSSGKRVTLTGKANGWYQVSFDGKTGYIYSDYITADSGVVASLPTVTPPAVEAPAPAVEPVVAAVEIPASPAEASSVESGSSESAPEGEANRSGFITGGTINVRTGPGTDYERITRVSTGKKINILSEENGWVKISFGDTVGYVSGDYVYEGDELPASASGVGAQVAALAPKYLGVPYVYGGSSPSGFDCSGFTSYLYKQFGYTLSRSASAQYANNGRRVSKSELQPGDLVYFSSPSSGGSVNHTAVYVGDGKIIHARYSMGKVYTNYLSESYYTKYYVGAIRVA